MVHRKNAKKIDIPKRYNEPEDQSKIQFRINRGRRRLRFIGKAVALVLLISTSGVGIFFLMSKEYNLKEQLYNEDIDSDYNNKYSEKYNGKLVNVVENVQKGTVLVKNGIKTSVGIVYSNDGYIIANKNMISDKNETLITTNDGVNIKANVIGVDDASNIAMLKANSADLTSIIFGDSNSVKEGEEIIYFSSNERNQNKLNICSAEVVSKDNKVFTTKAEDRVENKVYNILKVKNHIDENLGCEIVSNKNAEIIGINLGDNKENIDQNIAIASNDIKKISDEIIENQHILKNSLGIVAKNAKPRGPNGVKGAYIQEVVNRSDLQVGDMDEIGFKPTDIIISVDDQVIDNVEDLALIVKEKKSNDMIKCKVWRAGEVINIRWIIAK